MTKSTKYLRHHRTTKNIDSPVEIINFTESAPPASPAKSTSLPNVHDIYNTSPPVQSSYPQVIPPNKVEPAITGNLTAPPLDESQYNIPSSYSISSLRRKKSIDFESSAAVCFGATKNALKRFLPCLFDERDYTSYGELLRYIVIHQNILYVYENPHAVFPIYTIPLTKLRPIVEDSSRPHPRSITVSPRVNDNRCRNTLRTVLLVNTKGNLKVQLTVNVGNQKRDMIQELVKVLNKGSQLS